MKWLLSACSLEEIEIRESDDQAVVLLKIQSCLRIVQEDGISRFAAVHRDRPASRSSCFCPLSTNFLSNSSMSRVAMDIQYNNPVAP
jgi:hypothetical protein